MTLLDEIEEAARTVFRGDRTMIKNYLANPEGLRRFEEETDEVIREGTFAPSGLTSTLYDLWERKGSFPAYVYQYYREYPEKRELMMREPFLAECVRNQEALRLRERMHERRPDIFGGR